MATTSDFSGGSDFPGGRDFSGGLDLSGAVWVKSSYSGNGGSACVEWAPGCVRTLGVVPVRDSKDRRGPALAFSAAGWRGFVAAVAAGEFGVG